MSSLTNGLCALKIIEREGIPRRVAVGPSVPVWICMVAIAVALSSAAIAGGSLAIPVTDAQGQPIDVGLLILGHSTSSLGDWPAKLELALDGDPLDGRSYVIFRAITFGDGGFLWSQLKLSPGETQYDRVLASTPDQYCQDNSGTRWSCRRLRVDRGLTGVDPTPPECAPPCLPPAIAACSWHENGHAFQQANMSFKACWDKMDVRLALVQDTSNRSFALDDVNGDGSLDAGDPFLASDILPSGRPCGGGGGVIGAGLDWNCDGSLDAQDGSAVNYAAWLGKLSTDLLDGYGAASVSHVFFTQKPLEMNGCAYFPGETCTNHGLRTPTASRPFDHFYLPTIYWEYRALEELFATPGLDPRIHFATPADVKTMWKRSVQGYDIGLAANSWTIPAATGRPGAVPADDTENDALNAGTVGGVLADHVHHNTDGGWMMADVWFAGLRPYLANSLPAPSPAGDPAAAQAPLLVTSYNRQTGLLQITFGPACHATDHALHAGPLSQVAGYGYDLSLCGIGTTGQSLVDVGGSGSRFFLIAGNNDYVEGSLGTDSTGAQRPGPTPAAGCHLPLQTSGACP